MKLFSGWFAAFIIALAVAAIATKPSLEQLETHISEEIKIIINNSNLSGNDDLTKLINTLVYASCTDNVKGCVELARSRIKVHSKDWGVVRAAVINWMSGDELCLGFFNNWSCFPVKREDEKESESN